jgi:hypothetical protein
MDVNPLLRGKILRKHIDIRAVYHATSSLSKPALALGLGDRQAHFLSS